MFQPHKGNSSPSLSTYRGRKYICMSSIMYRGFMGLCYDLLKLMFCCPYKISAILFTCVCKHEHKNAWSFLLVHSPWAMINASNISMHCVARVDTVNKCFITVALPSFYFFTRLMSASRLRLNVANLVHSHPLLSFRPISVSKSPGSLWLQRDG